VSLTIIQVRNELLSKLGIEDPALATALALQDCVNAINGAMQALQTAGQDYFTREKLTLSITAGTAVFAVDSNVQAIIGPVRLNDTDPLRGLNSRGELDQFDRIFEGVSDFGAAAGTPVAYWIENLRSGTTGDINQINLWLAPAPSINATLVAECIKEPPVYVVADLSATTVLPIAQNYTETIFLPIARMLITRSALFSRPDIVPSLTLDYQNAMARLGMAGGFPNADQPKPERAVNA
jgi:hypothetical protein